MNNVERRRRQGFGLCLPGYRYCGPGCSGPGAPTNEVDACCKAHDECYRRYGPSKRCDEIFLNCLESKINPNTRTGRHARLFANFMKIRNGLRYYWIKLPCLGWKMSQTSMAIDACFSGYFHLVSLFSFYLIGWSQSICRFNEISGVDRHSTIFQ